MKKKCLLARVFCEAVNDAAVQSAERTQSRKGLRNKVFCGYYTMKASVITLGSGNMPRLMRSISFQPSIAACLRLLYHESKHDNAWKRQYAATDAKHQLSAVNENSAMPYGIDLSCFHYTTNKKKKARLNKSLSRT